MSIQSLFNRSTATGQTRFRRDLGAIAIGLLIASVALGAQGQALAETTDSTSNSISEPVSTSRGTPSNPLSFTGKVAPTDNVIKRKPRTDLAKSTTSAVNAKSSLFSDFEIFDADVSLYFDDDGDGYFYGIEVNFDADTDYAIADVYARLYLSLEGGPWELYHTTEVFTLLGDSGGDDYTVDTELYSGYPTAYYDVLIELYDYDTGDFVADFGPSDSNEMKDAPLEDQQKDAGIIVIGPEPIVSHSSGGGGSASLIGLGLLILMAVVRQRALPARIRTAPQKPERLARES